MATQFDFLLNQVRAAGVALAGGKVWFYEAGTSVNKNIWLDPAETTLAANPYTLDSNATARLYGYGMYRVVVKDGNGVTRFDWDEITPTAIDSVLTKSDQEINGRKTFTEDITAPNITANAAAIVTNTKNITANTKKLVEHTDILAGHTSDITALDGRMDTVETGQSSGVLAYATQAALFTNLAPAWPAKGYVGADPDPTKNGDYYKVGGAGTGSWVQSSFDRVAVVEGKVAAALDTADTGDIALWKDAQGGIAARLDAENQLFLGDDVFSVQQQITASKRAAYKAAALALSTQRAANAVESGRIYAAAKEADAGMVGDDYIKMFPILPESASDHYRIASAVKTAENVITIVYQKTIPNINTDAQNGVLEVVTAALDPVSKHVSISSSRLVVSYRSIVSPTHPTVTAFAANATVCRIGHGVNAGRILVFFSTNKDNADTWDVEPQATYFCYSDDNLATNTVPVGLALAVNEYWVPASGPNGIQLVYNTDHPGRLVIPGYAVSEDGQHFVTVYSDDGGANWTLGAKVGLSCNETCIAEDVNGDIYALARGTVPLGTPGGTVRSLLKSTDGGATFTLLDAAAYPDSVCNGAIIQASTMGSTPKFIHSNVTEQTYRGDLHVRVSYGSPQTADADLLVATRETRAAYTALAMFNAEDLLVIYEAKENFLGADGQVAYGYLSRSLCACLLNVKQLGV